MAKPKGQKLVVPQRQMRMGMMPKPPKMPKPSALPKPKGFAKPTKKGGY